MTGTRLHPCVRMLGLTVMLCLCALLVAGAGQARESTGSYTNPVSKGFADTFADPAIIKGKDGYWYAYGTSDPLREGEKSFHYVPISRSEDLVNWEYVGDAFNRPTEVPWADEDAFIWAPDIRYADGKYYLYYVVTQTTVTGERNDNAIGVATAPTPAGPWKDSGEPVVGPRRGFGERDDFRWTFDPSLFVDEDGTRYLYYGSYYGGIFVTELSPDGTRAVGEPTMVAIDNRYEGAYVVRHGGYYYLFASSANCCAGPTTGYSVYAGRSESPRGPFVDREGDSMTESRVGGSIVVAPNGNSWVGTGHNSIVTDLSGQDWLAYHAIDRSDPYLDEPFGINERPMLLDRLDWVDGWPVVRGGEGASEGRTAGPVTAWAAGSEFNAERRLGADWRSDGGAWQLVRTRDGQGHVSHRSSAPGTAYLVSRENAPAETRAEADLRLPADSGGAAGLVVAYRDTDNHAVAWLDAGQNALVTDVRVDGRSVGREKTPLPESFRFDTWHNVAAEIRGTTMSVEVTDARLHDPVAVQSRPLPAGARASAAVGVASRASRAEADNVGAAALYKPADKVVPEPEIGTLNPAYSDEFDDGALDPAWSWVRKPQGQEKGGVYRWPTQEGDIVGPSNSASVLLRAAPQGDYTVETRLDMDLGTDTVRNYQQGGLVVYVDGDLWLRLSHVAIWNTRQTEFGKEMPFADGLSFGGTLVGAPSETTWLRLSHRVDPGNGEHEFRAATSRDGENWVRGGVWTLPADAAPRIGLVSLGKSPDDPAATAEFEYFRVYSP